jgi:lycopene cyclase domain-containing protein
MTYFGFLLQFVVIPILILGVLAWFDHRRGLRLPDALRGYAYWKPIAAHMLIALVYTTPWDNYLVASRVWWYDPDLVTGILIWYVPIEEYTFFILQPILTSLWLVALARRLPVPTQPVANPAAVRRSGMIFFGILCALSVIKLLSGWDAGTYLALLLVWALPPVIFQMWFGGDILWKHRLLVGLGVLVPTLYLSYVDSLAITSGTWTINPEQSLNLFIGTLPFEEGAFFFMTNLLIVLGMTMMLARESQGRIPNPLRRWLVPQSKTPTTPTTPDLA